MSSRSVCVSQNGVSSGLSQLAARAARWSRCAAIVMACGTAMAPALPIFAQDRLAATPVAAANDALLAQDPRVITGVLPNGVKYAVMQHANPPGRVSVWMHVGSGSLNETDEQRGIAHYLEHMAFNGSENFAPGSVVDFFQSLGLRFGMHQNAFTSFDQTTYQLALPDNSIEKLDKALLFFADVSGRLLLDPKEIDEEREVILQEKTARKSPPQRTGEAVLKRMIPGSIIGERLPIGTDETLMAMQRPNFEAYYSKFYTPANTTVIAVGDLDTNVMIERITAAFGGFESKGEAPANQDPKVEPYTNSFGVLVTDPELTRASLSIQSITKPVGPSLTEGAVKRDLVQLLGFGAFNRRIQDKVSRNEMDVLGAGAASGDQFAAFRAAGVRAAAEPAKWREALSQTATELHRAVEHGFLASEVNTAKAELLASLEQGAKSESTLPSRAYLDRINSAITDGERILSSTQLYEMAQRLLADVTPAEVSAAFAHEMAMEHFMVAAQLPESLGDGASLPTEDELVAVVREAMSSKVDALAERATKTSLLDKEPAAGSIVEQSVHDATGTWTGLLSNNVLVHHRSMDYRKDQVMVSITLFGGDVDETDATRGITNAAGSAWANAATSTLSSTDIRDLMAGVKATVGGGLIDSGLVLTIGGDPADMEKGFQLAHLLLTDPFIEPPSFEQWKTANLQSIAARERNPATMMGVLSRESVYPEGDPRFTRLTATNVESLTRDAAQQRLLELIRTSPIEVAIVGDISREDAQELAAKYLGSLGNRPRVSADAFEAMRTLPREASPRSVTHPVETATPVAAVRVQFYGPDAKNVEDTRAMQVAAQVITTRMIKRIREELQLVYSISAGSSPAVMYPGFGVFGAGSTTQPGKTDALRDEILAAFKAFAENGPTQEELDVAKRQFANTLDEGMREPSFWTSRLSMLEFGEISLDEVLAGPEAYQAFTPEQVKETFVKYYSKGAPGVVITMPLAPELPVDAIPMTPMSGGAAPTSN
jgi:zinc protease